MEQELIQMVREKTKMLEGKFPLEANYCSRASLWRCGLRDGLISNEQYSLAEKYYGRLWNYVGD